MRHCMTPLLIAAVCMALLAACGPPEEQQHILDAVNNAPELKEKSGHIEKITFGESKRKDQDKDKNKRRPDHDNQDQRFEAEILDNDGNPIGKVRGFRVEGFGTRIGRVEWYGEEK